MDGDFDQYEEVDDDFLSSISLDNLTESTGQPSTGPGPVIKAIDKADLPDKFPFPFEPYDIQVGFMQQIYTALEVGKVGIFESPTGTGKSLSLICGALTWLRDYEERQRQELETLLRTEETFGVTIKQEPKEEPGLDWISAFAQKQQESAKTSKMKEEREQRLKREARLEQLRNNLKPSFTAKRKRDKLDEEFGQLFQDIPAELCDPMPRLDDTDIDCADQEFLIADYNSDDESREKANEEEEEEETTHCTKIYYCSRTHSQLTQFVREVQKSPFGEDTRVAALASRQNMCINDAVKRLKTISLINERCLELQKNKSESRKKTAEGAPKRKRRRDAGGCPFYKQEPLGELRDRMLVEVRDIEQLVGMGRAGKACPYYASRHAIPAAQLVVLPYNMLLHKATREACGIKVKDNIVIIDEAHNLSETISSIYRVEVTGAQLTLAYAQLTQYLERYRSRLKAKNLMYIRQILFILSNFIKCLGGKVGSPANQQHISKTGTRLQTINDFLFDNHLDNLNLFKVLKYCECSLISKKLHGFVEKYHPSVTNKVQEEKTESRAPTWALSKFLKDISQPKDQNANNTTDQVNVAEEEAAIVKSPLMNIESLLEALTNADKDGRIVISKEELLSQSSLKFVLLNPAVHFSEVVCMARSLIVAGGTMQPLSDFKDQLFHAAGVKPENILQFSCGHVIPPSNILPLALAHGSSGVQLDFTYQSRNNPQMMEELGRVVYNLCNIVPGGVICFFPSYEYEKRVYNHWETSGFLQKMAAKKKIFREPKKAGLVDQVLTEYSHCIQKHLANRYSKLTGGLLLCVVGGKMSEGINFSDELGRCVVMVGLPYPNIRSPELKEKMDYLNSHMPSGADGKQPGQVHYENLCMKAVNQSIGRAIRHKGDYAAILLLDYRYLRPAMRTKLPSWISDHLTSTDRFGPAFAALRKFFAEKKS